MEGEKQERPAQLEAGPLYHSEHSNQELQIRLIRQSTSSGNLRERNRYKGCDDQPALCIKLIQSSVK